MTNRILLTKPIFEWLIEQLVFIEESAEELARFYYPDLPMEEEKMKRFFFEYIKKIELELEKVDIVNATDKFRYYESLNEFPFVIIGSQAKVTNLTDNRIITFKIIHPVEDCKSQRNNEITYLSQLGKELLLKGVRSEVETIEPTGVQRFRIESIKLL